MTHFASYAVKNHHIYVIDDDGVLHPFCEEFYIAENLYDICTGKITFIINIVNSNGLITSVEMSRKEATMNPLPALADAGLSVSNISEYKETLTEILHDMEKHTPVTLVHSKLGFQDINGTKVFLAGETNTPLGASKYSKYDKLQPRGTFEEWRYGVIPFLEEKPEMTLAIAMGASAPIAGLLKTAGVLTEGNVFALVGPSSRGKTSGIRLAADIWGVADTSDGVIDTLDDTENFFTGTLASANSFPKFVDEGTLCRWDFTSIIYGVSLNKGRGRCNADGSLKPVPKWMPTSLVFTSEIPMVSQTRGTSGISARAIEFDFLWTKDASYAERLAKFVSCQCGTAYKPYIDTLTAIPLADLSSMYQAHIDNLKQRIAPKNGVEDRILKKLSLLRLTVEIMTTAWDIPVDINAIDKLLIEAFEQNIPKADKYEVLYETLTQYIFSHAQLFPDEETLKIPQLCKISKQGMHSTYNGKRCVWLLSTFFDAFLQNNGMASITSNHREMQNRGMLVYHSDRFKKIKTLGKSGSVLCYCLLLDRTSHTPSSTTKKKNSKKSPQLTYLLSEEAEE